MTEHQKENKKALETAKKILDTMPKWKREYVESIIESILSEDEMYPKMFV